VAATTSSASRSSFAWKRAWWCSCESGIRASERFTGPPVSPVTHHWWSFPSPIPLLFPH